MSTRNSQAQFDSLAVNAVSAGSLIANVSAPTSDAAPLFAWGRFSQFDQDAFARTPEGIRSAWQHIVEALDRPDSERARYSEFRLF